MRVLRPVPFALLLIAAVYAPTARGQSDVVTSDLEEGMKPYGYTHTSQEKKGK